MITIPTTELIGGLSDTLPHILDPKSSLAGVAVEWTGEALRFTAYDIYSGACVEWIPGEGAEGEINDQGDDDQDDEIVWGGDDAPWRTWIWLDQAKEILKLFKLPAKLWRVPVTVKHINGDLVIERTDSPAANRLLRVPGDPKKARTDVPDVWATAGQIDGDGGGRLLPGTAYFHQRLGAFGAARSHGSMVMVHGFDGQPTGVLIGTRLRGFIYQSGTKGVQPFNFLRDGSGLAAGKPDLDAF